MHTDPISDLLTRVRNAIKAQHKTVEVPHSNIKQHIAEILVQNQMVKSCNVQENDKKQKQLLIELLPERKQITLKRVSKPGQRIYKQWKDIRNVKSGYGIGIYSTTKGIMTDKEAKSEHCGGELLCEVY